MTQQMVAASPIKVFRETLDKQRKEISSALPPQIPADKFIRTILTIVQLKPALLQADRKTLIAACMKAAQDGLFPDDREAALVLFGSKVNYLVMFHGLLKQLYNTGGLKKISAHVVYEKDAFDYTLGDNESIMHKPYLGQDRGKPVAAYAIAHTLADGTYRDVMSFDEIEHVRKKARKTGEGGPWGDWWGEMAKKTVVRRMAKYLPRSAEALGQDVIPVREAPAPIALPEPIIIPEEPPADSAFDAFEEEPHMTIEPTEEEAPHAKPE
jgi:recombination protein RecT